MSETITLHKDAVNAAFDNELDVLIDGQSSKFLSGFTGFATITQPDGNSSNGYYIPAHFVICRINDGKLFAAKYDEVPDGADSPFSASDENVEFHEVEYRTRTVTVEYLEVI